MPRRTSRDRLRVFLNSRLVGLLRRETSGAISFQYDRSWLEWDSALPASLSLPLREQAYLGAPVLAVFENLLPDKDTLRRQIAARAHAEGTDAYSLLRAIGHDCVGALQFLPEDSEPTPAGVIDAVPVSEREIAVILHNLATAPLGITEDESFRISIAGAQEKTALLRWNGRWCKPRGTTATTHIFKPTIGKLPKHNWLAIDRSFRQIVEPGQFLFQLASLFVMISRHGEDLLTSNPATVFENPGLVPDAEVPQKIKNVIRLHRGIQAFKNCLIHFSDGRKRPAAIADDVGMSQMEISSEPCIWHRLRSKRRLAVAALSISNGHVENLDTRDSEPTRYASERALNHLHFSHPYVLSGRTNSSIASGRSESGSKESAYSLVQSATC